MVKMPALGRKTREQLREMETDAIRRAAGDSVQKRREILDSALESEMFDPALARKYEESVADVCLPAESGVNLISPETGQVAVDAASEVHKIGERISKRQKEK